MWSCTSTGHQANSSSVWFNGTHHLPKCLASSPARSPWTCPGRRGVLGPERPEEEPVHWKAAAPTPAPGRGHASLSRAAAGLAWSWHGELCCWLSVCEWLTVRHGEAFRTHWPTSNGNVHTWNTCSARVKMRYSGWECWSIVCDIVCDRLVI